MVTSTEATARHDQRRETQIYVVLDGQHRPALHAQWCIEKTDDGDHLRLLCTVIGAAAGTDATPR